MSIEVKLTQDQKATSIGGLRWVVSRVRLPRMSWFLGFNLFLLAYLALGILALGIISFSIDPLAAVSPAAVFGRAVLFAGCSFAAAATVGFLFGVPHPNRRPDRGPAPASYWSTNLEDVSD